MDLAVSEIKVWNEISMQQEVWQMKTQPVIKGTRLKQIFVLHTTFQRVLLCQALHKCKNSKPSNRMSEVWCNIGVALHFQHSQWLPVYYVVVLWVFTTLLEFWFTSYPFLTPRTANTTILYFHNVVKTLNCHLNHMHKFTIITYNYNNYDHF